MSKAAVRVYEGNRKWHFTPSFIRTARKHVEYLQKTLFRAIKEKWKLRVVNRFRRLLKNSYLNKVLAIYQTTQLNTGKRTAGIDRVKIKVKSQAQLDSLTKRLCKDVNGDKWKPKPNRRIDIPKPDGTTRPLGIPTHYDKIVQAILTTILDVEHENLVSTNKLSTFGFRKKMSTADAIGLLKTYAWQGKKALVIEADIAKCFDQISHKYILNLLANNKAILNPTGKLLKAGHWDLTANEVITSDVGTPQGGVISPVLSNMVLRQILDLPFKDLKIFNSTVKSLITYADDLVITISPNGNISNNGIKYQTWIDSTKTTVFKWLDDQLAIAGLKVKPSKTKAITEEPFTFLGYEIQRGKGIRLDPNKVRRLRNKLNEHLRRGFNKQRVLEKINPILRGFYNYAAKFSSGKMWKQIEKIDFDVGKRCKKLYGNYDIGQVKYTDIPKTVIYYSHPKGATWLDNPDYWQKRDLKLLPPRKRKMYKNQQGKCGLCNCHMECDDILNTHHVKPKGRGGKDKNSNVMLVHMACHNRHHESGELLLPKEVAYG